MGARGVKTRNHHTLTEAAFFGKIRSALRNAFKYSWQPAKIALKRAERPSQSANKRLKLEYQCAHCKNWFPREQVHIDHIIECGSLNNLEEVAGFIERLLPEDPDAFQILCKDNCHRKKTNEARKNKK